MPPSQRINLQELKAKLLKVLGPEKENQYFIIFCKFLNHRLTKAELDRQVLLTIGKENIALHNQLVKAILSNATCGESPSPPSSAYDTSKLVKGTRRKPLTPSPGNDESAPQSPALSNGDVTIRKARTGVRDRDRKAKERQSLLGPHGREEASTSQGQNDDAGAKTSENGKIDTCRPLQQLTAAEQPYWDQKSTTTSLKRPRLDPSGKAETPILTVKTEDEVVDENGGYILRNSPISAPLGIPFCVGSIGAARKASLGPRLGPLTHTLLGHRIEDDCLEATDLPDTDILHCRMEHIAAAESGLKGVSNDAANLLNHALDVYLKSLISASVELVKSRRPKNGERQASKEQGAWDRQEAKLSSGKVVPGQNGTWPNHSFKPAGLPLTVDTTESKKQYSAISPLDFKVAMELNSHLLGENRPSQMERIMLRVFEQQQRVLH